MECGRGGSWKHYLLGWRKELEHFLIARLDNLNHCPLILPTSERLVTLSHTLQTRDQER